MHQLFSVVSSCYSRSATDATINDDYYILLRLLLYHNGQSKEKYLASLIRLAFTCFYIVPGTQSGSKS